MNHDEMAPIIDKILHADGSVTTIAGAVLLPADPNRAKEFQSRAANVDKWLHPDGSVTDSAGRVIMEADESRARDYASRMALAVVMTEDNQGGGNTGNPTFEILEGDAHLIPVVHLDLGEMSEDLTTPDGILRVTDAADTVLG